MPTFEPDAAREISRAQQTLQLERFQILQAALAGNYKISPAKEEEPTSPLSPLSPKPKYIPSFQIILPEPLEPVNHVVFLDESNGFENLSAEALVESLRDIDTNEKYREGGILYLVSDTGIFWTMIELRRLNGTTGNDYWDDVLDKAATHPKDHSYIDCMFFSTPFGCLQSSTGSSANNNSNFCPFRHDTQRKIHLRERVISERLERLGAPTLEERQKFARRALDKLAERENRQPTEDEMDQYFDLYVIGDNRIRVFCHYCETPELADAPLFKRCKCCRAAWYCSPECQKKDWKSHKPKCIEWKKVVYRD